MSDRPRSIRGMLGRLRVWLRRRREARSHVPTDMAEAIRDHIGPRVTDGPPGLHSGLYETIRPRRPRRPRREEGRRRGGD